MPNAPKLGSFYCMLGVGNLAFSNHRVIKGKETQGIHWRRKDFLIGGAQFETTHRVVSNLYNNLSNCI